jgi:hypothetical protein
MAPHPLDHLVLPTRDLATARARLGALGFTVAPQGTHPFGTVNCCVYLADGTFMEPLAVGDAGAARQAVEAGNVFVARDGAFRARHGEEGFSAVVFGTGDADADHARYETAGISAGPRLDFSRPFVDANGKSDTASFRLAFAGDGDNPDAFVFACERVNAPKVDRAALQAHANGARAIREVVGVASAPSKAIALLSEAADALKQAGGTLRLPNAVLSVVTPAMFRDRYGLDAPVSALRFTATVFAVEDMERLKSLLAAGSIGHDLRDGRIVVPSQAGQGAVFVFEENI